MIEYVDELPKGSRNQGFVRDLLNEFLASGKNYAKVSIDGRTGKQLYATIYNYLHNHIDDIPVNPHVRNGECYLERLY